MNKICNLSYNDFSTYDQFDEELPRTTDGLIAHFPLDNSIDNRVPEFDLSVSKSKIVTKGLMKDAIIKSNGLKINTNSITMTNSYIELNSDLLKSMDNLNLYLKISFNSSDNENETILSCANSTNKIFFNVKMNKADKVIYCEILNSQIVDKGNYKNNNCFLLCDYGDVYFNAPIELIINLNDGVMSSILNGDSKRFYRIKNNLNMTKIIIGQMLNKDITSYNFDTTKGYSGEIEAIKINSHTNIFSEDCVRSQIGLLGNTTTKAINQLDFSKKENNKNMILDTDANAKVNIGESIYYDFMGYPIESYSAFITSDCIRYLDKYKLPGISLTSKFEFPANTTYTFMLYFKAYKNENLEIQLLNVTNSNITKVYEHNIKLDDDWNFYYVTLKNSSNVIATIDLTLNFISSKHYNINENFSILSTKLLYVNNELPCQYPLKIEKNVSQNVISGNDVNKFIDNFSFGFEFIPTTSITENKFPQIFMLSNYTDDNSKDYIEVCRGSGWGNCSQLFFAIISKGTKYATRLSMVNKDLIGHKIYAGFSYDKSTHKILSLFYDMTDLKYLSKNETINENFSFSNFDPHFFLGYDSYCILKNFSLYNRTLTLSDFENNYINKFSINSKGTINADTINEDFPIINKNNVYTYKLRNKIYNSEDHKNSLFYNSSKEFTELEDGFLVGSLDAKITLDLIDPFYINEPFLSDKWNQNLHNDAVTVNNWSQGPIDEKQYKDGYFSKFVLQGQNANPCIKFIDRNGEYNDKNRKLYVIRKIGATEFGLWSILSPGSEIKILFKAKTDTIGSKISIGFSNYKKNSTIVTANKFIDVSLNKEWENYSLTFKIDNDWDLKKDAYLNITNLNNTIESTMWISNVVLIVSDYTATPDEAINAVSQTPLCINLNKTAMNNNTYNHGKNHLINPWTIMYWKKPISACTNSKFNLESLGIGGTDNYVFWGHDNIANAMRFYCSGQNISTPINDSDYWNKWQLVALKYDGVNITITIMGEKINIKKSIPLSIKSDRQFYVNSSNRDLMLGGYEWGDKITTSCSIYKDLILAYRCLSDKEIKDYFSNKFSYRYKTLIAQCNLKEI